MILMVPDKASLDEKGSALIEMAMILPVLLMLVLGVIEFGLFLYNKQVITNAVREGAREGVLMRAAPRDPDEDLLLIKAKVKEWANNHLVTFGTDKTMEDDDIDIPAYTEDDFVFGNDLQVEATWEYTFLVLPEFVNSLIGSITIHAETVMKRE